MVAQMIASELAGCLPGKPQKPKRLPGSFLYICLDDVQCNFLHLGVWPGA